mmetsp:Transcript_35371/g.114551  ORF Transcript_35371/g.114551 Transcript_35371/m.114551 type:complete len:223 (-) Transcript_35371:5255-5923(-)
MDPAREEEDHGACRRHRGQEDGASDVSEGLPRALPAAASPGAVEGMAEVQGVVDTHAHESRQADGLDRAELPGECREQEACEDADDQHGAEDRQEGEPEIAGENEDRHQRNTHRYSEGTHRGPHHAQLQIQARPRVRHHEHPKSFRSLLVHLLDGPGPPPVVPLQFSRPSRVLEVDLQPIPHVADVAPIFRNQEAHIAAHSPHIVLIGEEAVDVLGDIVPLW